MVLGPNIRHGTGDMRIHDFLYDCRRQNSKVKAASPTFVQSISGSEKKT